MSVGEENREPATLPDAERAAELIRPLAPQPRGACDDRVREPDGPVSALERYAIAIWSSIAEPGDRAAVLLTRLLGAAEALRCLLAPRPLAALLERIPRDEQAEREWLRGELPRAIARWSPRAQLARGEALLTGAAQLGAQLITPLDAAWPAQLDDLGEHAPLAVWCRGAAELLGEPARMAAIVGARAASGYGEHVAIELAAGLADRGIGVVSGGAYGIDGAAHRASLLSEGATIAVMAGGVDRLYPRGNTQLLQRIMRDGLLLSELPCGQAPTRWRFLQRNRIIAALAGATVVVEAGERSGALNTAAHAASIARPLGAVPGPVTAPSSAGCHRMLRDFDAVCVRDAADAHELVRQYAGGWSDAAFNGGRGADVPADEGNETAPGHGIGRDSAGTRVWNALSQRTARSVEQIALAAGLSLADVRGVLSLLEIEGLAHHGEQGWTRGRASSRASSRDHA